MRIPEKGMDKAKLFETLKGYRTNDLASKGGRTWAYVYDTGRAEIDEVAKEAYTAFLSENGLDPTVFPSLLRLENEIVAMARTHLNGDENVVGNFTSGGTESIILAVKAARDRARAERPEIREPEMILPVTAHAAFHKAAHYLDVKTVMTPVDPVTFKADPDAVEKAVTENTVLIVGSAVSYAHGVIDPIEDLGRIALENDVLLHVDGCVGAFLLPYFKRLGSDVPPVRLFRTRRHVDLHGLPQVRVRSQGRIHRALSGPVHPEIPALCVLVLDGLHGHQHGGPEFQDRGALWQRPGRC